MMTHPDTHGGKILLLGRDHPQWGEVSIVCGAEGRTAVAMTAGADPRSPAMASKGRHDAPNEDAVLTIDDGRRTLLAVADAHHGIEASHGLLEALAESGIPDGFPTLVEGLSLLEPTQAPGDSASTLLVAVIDRATATGFGISFGDSSLVLVGLQGARVVNVRRAQYIHLRDPEGLDPELGHGFQFFLDPGELVLAFTDGINECHYRSPEKSVREEHLAQLFGMTGPRPEVYARRLVELALSGVDGHPGGQDNIALAVTATGTES